MKATRMLMLMMMLLLIGAFAFSIGTYVAMADGDHHHEEAGCENPTYTVAVAAENTRFNVTEIKVPRNTCVQLFFENKDDIEHDINVDEVEGEFSGFHVHLTGAGVANTTFMTPDKDVTYIFYCTVPGHREAGMEGKLIVGEGSPEDTAGVPGFEMPAIFGALLLVSLAAVAKTKKGNF